MFLSPSFGTILQLIGKKTEIWGWVKVCYAVHLFLLIYVT